ncbi:MAG: hypothetical protein RR527_03240 [Clostridia bacterium]
MKNVKLTIKLLVSLGIVLYLVFVPGYLIANLGVNHYTDWKRGEPVQPVGIIKIWHIAGFKTYSGSVGSWLSERAKKIERKHYGLFFDILSMSLEECNERVQRGETADIYSFPSGWGYVEQFAPMEREYALAYDLQLTGCVNATPYAVPYLFSGYALVVNTFLAQSSGLTTIEGDPAQWLAKTVASSQATIAGNPVVAAVLGLNCQIEDISKFIDGKCAIALCDYKTIGTLAARQMDGKGFVFDVYPVTEYTDQVQFIGFSRNISVAKMQGATEFVDSILSEKSQKSLTGLGAASVINIEPDASALPDAIKNCIKRSQPFIFNTFIYNAKKNILNETAALALTGDVEASHDFSLRLKELVYNGKIQ